jgi:hypothetical protein
MQSDLKGLQFLEKELEELSEISLERGFMRNLFRLFAKPKILKRDRALLWSPIALEILVFCLTLIISLPVALLVSPKSTYSPDDPQIVVQFLTITLILSPLLTLAWNVYIWFKAKSLATLVSLLDEVDKYNEIIQAVDVLDRLAAVGNSQVTLLNRDETIAALRVARESLICALKTERILRENQNLVGRRSELFANIENNLSALMIFDTSDRANEYSRLLNEALEIGLSVQREVRKL